MIDLETIKRDERLLLAELKIERAGLHCKCPFHDDKTGSLNVNQRDGIWFWKCMSGCGGGTIIDAVMLSRGLKSLSSAMATIEKEIGMRFDEKTKQQNRNDIGFDTERGWKFVRLAHHNLCDNLDIQSRWMLGKRGLSLFACECHVVGFMENFTFEKWPTWNLPAAWILPITRDGVLRAIKLHFEKRPLLRDGTPGPKCLWAPFGVQKHSVNVLWPPPPPLVQTWNGSDYKTQDDWLYLCPGELKALARISHGYIATSPTCGEGSKILDSEIARLSGWKVRICYDNDEAGIKWRDAVAVKVSKVANECETITMENTK